MLIATNTYSDDTREDKKRQLPCTDADYHHFDQAYLVMISVIGLGYFQNEIVTIALMDLACIADGMFTHNP